MIPDIKTALAIVVFAGGPHTSTRYELLQDLLPELKADAIFLTGADFQEHHVGNIQGIPVFTDDCKTTITSCFSLARRMRQQHPEGIRVLVITSNYHAPRVSWLLRGILPRKVELTFKTSRDMTWENLRGTRLSKRLLAGEIKSWLYCFPAGLILRPLPTSIVLLLVSLVAVRVHRGKEARTTRERGHP